MLVNIPYMEHMGIGKRQVERLNTISWNSSRGEIHRYWRCPALCADLRNKSTSACKLRIRWSKKEHNSWRGSFGIRREPRTTTLKPLCFVHIEDHRSRYGPLWSCMDMYDARCGSRTTLYDLLWVNRVSAVTFFISILWD